MGIHGEPGVRRTAVGTADQIAVGLLDHLLDDRRLGAGERVALLVNGLGATPPMELSVLAGAAVRHLRKREVRVERLWVGTS